MVWPDNIYKTEAKDNGVILSVFAFFSNMKSKFRTKLQRIYFERDSLPKLLLSRFYYNTILDVKESSKFAN